MKEKGFLLNTETRSLTDIVGREKIRLERGPMVGTVNSAVESVCGLHNELDRGEVCQKQDRGKAQVEQNCMSLKIPAI